MIKRTLISVSVMETKSLPKNVTKDKRKYCITCGNLATKEALFRLDVDQGVTLLERYCNTCVSKVK